MSIEAMRQALEALDSFSPYSGNTWIQESEVDIDSAITALRQAIEQVEKQEPVAWMYRYTREDIIKMARKAGLQRNGYWEFSLMRLERFAEIVKKNVHTAPPKPEWTGLTDEERERIILENIENVTVSEAVMFKTVSRATEAKLKEKNHG
jgi:hypothetical protein